MPRRSLTGCLAGRVSENFDDSAGRDFPVVALVDHPGEFGPKPQQPADSAFYGFELIGSDPAHLLAGRFGHFLQSEHRFDGRNVETEISGMADKCQPPNVLRSIEASSTVGAGRRRYESDPLVVANRLDVDARMFGQGSDSDHLRVDSVVATGCTYSK